MTKQSKALELEEYELLADYRDGIISKQTYDEEMKKIKKFYKDNGKNIKEDDDDQETY